MEQEKQKNLNEENKEPNPALKDTSNLSPSVILFGSSIGILIVTGVMVFNFYPYETKVPAKIQETQSAPLSEERSAKTELSSDFSISSVVPAVVKLECYDDNKKLISQGSGASMYLGTPEQHWITTNAHVVRGDTQLGELTHGGCYVYFPYPDGTFYQSAYWAGEIHLYDDHITATLNDTKVSGLDYALLKITDTAILENGPTFPSYQSRTFPDIFKIKTCQSGRPINIGEKIFFLGYPAIGGENLTITEGIVSGIDGNFREFLKTSAKGDYGNSGGLAVSANDGCPIGIPTAVVRGDLESIGLILTYDFINLFIKNSSYEQSSGINEVPQFVRDDLEVAKSRGRDASRIAEVTYLRLILEFYFGEYNSYPPNLSSLISFKLDDKGFNIPLDPLTNQPYFYTGCGKNYHIGANLENNLLLDKDDDKTLICPIDLINGSDAQGCDGKKDFYCFDAVEYQ